MAVPRRLLRTDESVLVDIHPHWMFLFGPMVATAIVVGAAVVLDVVFLHTSVTVHWIEGLVAAVPCLWFVLRSIRWRTSSLVVTSQRILERSGPWRPNVVQIPLVAIEDVDVQQSFLRRLLGTGQVVLTLDEGVRLLGDVRKPMVFRRIVLRRSDRLQQEQGYHHRRGNPLSEPERGPGS